MKIWQYLFGKKEQQEEERYILCIDGGGMRGIIPIQVLKYLENKLKEHNCKKNLIENFDLVSGTSTGGLIALSLSCQNGKTLEEMENQYMYCGPYIFPIVQNSFFGIKRLLMDKYPTDGIESVLDSWFCDKTMKESTIPTMVVSYDLSIGKEKLIRSWEESDFLVKDAARATSAAPTYFAPLVKDNSILVDGGVIANNPSIYAYYEAKKLYPNCKKFTILSLSTAGICHTMSLNETSGLISWADSVVPMYTTAQKQNCNYILENERDVSYLRIDGQMDIDIKMDDVTPESLNYMKEFGKVLAIKNETALEDIVCSLTSKKL